MAAAAINQPAACTHSTSWQASCQAALSGLLFTHSTLPTPLGGIRPLQVGDWGRQGDFNQSAVAAAMARKAAAMRTDFVISTGLSGVAGSWVGGRAVGP